MAAPLMKMDTDDLGTVAESFNQASTQFASTKSQFVSAGSPNFGILLSFVKPFYGIAKDSTVSYLGNIESMLGSISKSVEGTAKDAKNTEDGNTDRIHECCTCLEGTSSEQSSGNSSPVSSGGGSSAADTNQYQPVQQPDQSTMTPQSSETPKQDLPGISDSDTTNTVGLDTNGDTDDDYSVNLTEGNTHATINDDGSVTLSKQDVPTVPLPPGASTSATNKGNSFTVDTNHDGRDDVALTPDAGDDSRISVFEDGDSQYAAIDFDNDGDYDAAVRIGDSEAAYEKIQQEAEASVWEEISRNDPLGRSVEELQALYADRDIMSLPEQTEISAGTSTRSIA
ncbi:hypothetical protein JS530_03335 [Bifidobacterium sp. LC6]|uniref:Uncharacterized protein n=1 Tax=Bifidobacterium colobi TaxID=2809026 RepID=A0ABS5UUZ3_9BIFI|nr:hypothetical protein [Bifidobacterium colobi]MBT1174551.1 hypothetical protein [Bifidobacterium colobi]